MSPTAKATVKRNGTKAALLEVVAQPVDAMKCLYPRCADGCKGHGATIPDRASVHHVSSWEPLFPVGKAITFLNPVVRPTLVPNVPV
jgi:hypothetical protein